MNKLKTLNDLEIEVVDQVQGQQVIHKMLVDSVDLRSEAIKHIKAIEEIVSLEGSPDISMVLPYTLKEDTSMFPDWRDRLFEKRDWIKHFFNITEEDLK